MKVKLKARFGEKKIKEFEIEHANSIFELQRKTPPKSWDLADENFTVNEFNKIVPVDKKEKTSTSLIKLD